ncbi:epididymal sperm-binding protein 1-like [Anolis sagrei]|uniref:epididymal sperm-binding protein 1-like n=1 Tax=Anolis sagrei TaxID=38937 RepID=UPI0035219AA1
MSHPRAENGEQDLIAQNPLCVFPFIYEGVSYNACTTEGMSDGKLWCASTSNYDVDKKWVYCNATGADADQKSPCVFPFIYNQKIYLSCTTDGMVGKKPWCSLTTNYNTGLQWTYCEPLGPGEVMEKPPCFFPFVYKGNVYNDCTPDGRRDRRLWCATTDSYDVDNKGKFCQESGKEGGPDTTAETPSCIFPFIFKNMLYSTCTSEGMRDGKLWCATTSNYDVDKKWVYCNVTGRMKRTKVSVIGIG